MFKRSLVILLLALSSYIDIAQCQESYISWYYRGTAQQNNSVLTFNMGDTLNLVCKGYYYETGYSFWMFITKAASAPSGYHINESGDNYQLEINDAGSLIFDDFEGIQPGFENFVIVPSSYGTAVASGNDFRYIGIALLRPEDAGTYHCSGLPVYYDSYWNDFEGEKGHTSGGLTIVVNTKDGQARSSMAKANQAMAYSALFLSASKLLL